MGRVDLSQPPFNQRLTHRIGGQYCGNRGIVAVTDCGKHQLRFLRGKLGYLNPRLSVFRESTQGVFVLL